ncbi:MAG: ABC transporter ATP-binding protein [Spirochaetota bacterium]
MGILQIRNLSLTLGGNDILRDLSLDLWEGHIHALVGPNGAGKSTLAAVVMGLEGFREHTGDILLRGESIKELSVDERARRGITLAWQEPARFEGLPVHKFVLAGAKERTAAELSRVLSMVGLDPNRYRKRAMDEGLSGGERKRIELASILAMKPAIMMMDEPDSGVDIDALDFIFEVIREMKEEGITVILITHSAEVVKHADHGFLLCDGHILEQGVPNKIFNYFENSCAACEHPNEPPDEEASGEEGPGKPGPRDKAVGGKRPDDDRRINA